MHKENLRIVFNELCSIYSDALDNVGRYVDQETGECIQQMTIREFCLTDRWKPYVEKLRALRAEFGSKAKKMQEYIDTKKHLPGATLSGLFAIYDDECTRKDGTKFIAPVSRRETHLQQHTGWLAIDIDLGDNQNLSNFENIAMICRFRPEIALLMRSCSGTGYFGLVKLAYPEEHKAQFKALMKEYAALGITLDKQCSNIGRVRFASWDEPSRIYINEKAVPYRGLEKQEGVVLAPKAAVTNYSHQSQSSAAPQNGYTRPDHWWEDRDYILRMTELLVSAMVSGRHSITSEYGDWVKVGWSLKHHPQGERLFHQLSSIDPNYKPGETSQKWNQLGGAKTVTHEYLFSQCRHALGDEDYKRISREAWNSRY